MPVRDEILPHRGAVEPLSLVTARGHVAACDDDGGQIAPRCGHYEAGHDLVACPDHHRRVVARVLDHHLDGGGDQVAARQDILESHVAAALPVAGGENIEDRCHSSGLPDAALDGGSYAVQVIRAGEYLVPGVRDRNEGLFQVLIVSPPPLLRTPCACSTAALRDSYLCFLSDGSSQTSCEIVVALPTLKTRKSIFHHSIAHQAPNLQHIVTLPSHILSDSDYSTDSTSSCPFQLSLPPAVHL